MKEAIEGKEDKCKHSLAVGTCWLCAGGRQEQPRSGGDGPSWLCNLTQLAIRRMNRPKMSSAMAGKTGVRDGRKNASKR